MVMSWYAEHATPFVQEFGLMEGLVRKLGLDGAPLRLFLAKLSAIHNSMLRMRAREIEKGK